MGEPGPWSTLVASEADEELPRVHGKVQEANIFDKFEGDVNSASAKLRLKPLDDDENFAENSENERLPVFQHGEHLLSAPLLAVGVDQGAVVVVHAQCG